jgi:hypothetical protein
LKGLFVWIDDAREQRGFAAAQSLSANLLAKMQLKARVKSNDDALKEVSYAPFRASVLPQSCKLSRWCRGFRVYSTCPVNRFALGTNPARERM